MPWVISTKGGGRIEQVADKNGDVLKAWDDMCILNSAVMLSWGINALCNPILHGSPWIQAVYTSSLNVTFLFFLEWLAKVQAGLFLLEAQSDDSYSAAVMFIYKEHKSLCSWFQAPFQLWDSSEMLSKHPSESNSIPSFGFFVL